MACTTVAVIVTAISISLACSTSGEEAVTVTVTTKGAAVTVTETVIRMPAPNPRAGKLVFATTCAKCHTLTLSGGTSKKVNLADLQPAYEVVVEKVTNGGILMPAYKGRLSEQQIRDVAAFVASTARRAGRRD